MIRFLLLLLFIQSLYAVDIQEFGAIGDGKFNNNEVFIDAIDRAKETDRKIHISAGRFLVDSIAVPSNFTVEGDGPISVLVSHSGACIYNENWGKSSNSNIVFKDFAIDGENICVNGAVFGGVINGQITGLTVQNVLGYNIWLCRSIEGNIQKYPSKNIIVSGCHIFNIVDTGIEGWNLYDSIISNNYLSGSNATGAIILWGGAVNNLVCNNIVVGEPNNTIRAYVLHPNPTFNTNNVTTKNNTFIGNMAKNCFTGFKITGASISNEVEDCSFINNTIVSDITNNHSTIGAELQFTKNINIENNIIRGVDIPFYIPKWSANTTKVFIERNSVFNSGNSLLYDFNTSILSNNKFINSAESLIFNGTNNIVENNIKL